WQRRQASIIADNTHRVLTLSVVRAAQIWVQDWVQLKRREWLQISGKRHVDTGKTTRKKQKRAKDSEYPEPKQKGFAPRRLVRQWEIQSHFGRCDSAPFALLFSPGC